MCSDSLQQSGAYSIDIGDIGGMTLLHAYMTL